MKSNRATFGRSLDQPDPAVRFYLFFGPDEAGSRALADRLLKSLAAQKLVVSAAALKADPGLLADEAGAMGLFGDRRAVWIEPAGDEIGPAVDALLAMPLVESTTIAVGGALKKSSTLLKLAEAGAAAWCHASYPLEGRDADRLVVELGRLEGLRMSGDIARRIAVVGTANQSVIASELTKYALFLGATADSPRELDHDTVDKLGADNGHGGSAAIGDLALDGQLEELAAYLQDLSPGASDIIPTVRSLQRRVLQLIPLRARIESGERLDGVMTSVGKSLFWKDKPVLQRLLSQWSAARLAQLHDRIAKLERRLLLAPSPGEADLGEELVAIARAVRR